MSRILVVYGTTDGHTAKVAGALGEMFRDDGDEADVVNAAGIDDRIRPLNYDGVIVAGSIHIANYQRAVKRWIRTHVTALNQRPTAFLSVGLGILAKRPEAQREVREIMDRLLWRTGWTPAIRKPVAGALRYTRYNWFKRWIMRRIAAKVGMDLDTTRDYEYTDWDDLRVFAKEFRRLLAPAPVGSPPSQNGAPARSFSPTVPSAPTSGVTAG